MIGGIGVFFPGPDGFATFEQGFVPGIGQTEFQRTNAPKVLEAEYIALAAIGSSKLAGVNIGTLGGIPQVPCIDLPFGRIDLVGIQLQILGPTAGPVGVQQLLQFGASLGTGTNNGVNVPIDRGPDTIPNNGDEATSRAGLEVPDGFLVTPQNSAVTSLTAGDVEQLINQSIATAREVRAAIRLSPKASTRLPLNVDPRPGGRTRMVIAVTDTSGEVLGLFRMQDATIFSIDVAVAKARNVAYYADATMLQPEDQVVDAGVAFTNRTFRFLAEPRFPAGVDGSQPPPFSILNNPSINRATAENLGPPASKGSFDDTVLGFDSFNPGTNFRDPGDPSKENGVVFFPGSIPIYKDGVLVGGLGISGDGVDQDDVVTFFGSLGFMPTVVRADQTGIDGVRLPFIKFNRNPFS